MYEELSRQDGKQLITKTIRKLHLIANKCNACNVLLVFNFVCVEGGGGDHDILDMDH